MVAKRFWILLFSIILFFTMLDSLLHAGFCEIQLRAANTRPLTIREKDMLFHAVTGLVLFMDARIVFLYVLVLLVNVYVMGESSFVFDDIRFLLIPFILLNLVVTLIFHYVIYGWQFYMDIDMYYLASIYSTMAFILYAGYAAIYYLPRYIERKKLRRLLAGISIGLSSSLISIMITALIQLVHDPVIYECSARSLGIKAVNPYTFMFEALDTVRLSLVVGLATWFTLYVYFYFRRLSAKYSSR